MNGERYRETILLERKISEIDPRLPYGIKKHIRELKRQGRLYEAINFREQQLNVRRTPGQKLQLEKKLSLRQLLTSDSERIQALSALKLTWICSYQGEITDAQREADLFKIHRTWPDQGDYLLTQNAVILVEIANILHPQPFSNS